MGKKNAIDTSRPLLTVTIGEFQDIIREAIGGRKETGARTTAKGLGELASHLGCGRSKVSELRSRGVLDGAVVSKVGRETVFDVDKARRLASEYGKKNKQ
jgi:hypothetical protein